MTTNQTTLEAKTSDDVIIGDAAKLRRLGRALAFGLEGKKIDVDEGEKFLKMATEKGDLGAQAELAFLLLLRGADGIWDKEQAFELAKEPAQGMDPLALLVVSSIMRDGGTSKCEANETRALQFECEARQELCFRAEKDELAAKTLPFSIGDTLKKNESTFASPAAWLASSPEESRRGRVFAADRSSSGIERVAKEAQEKRWTRQAEDADVAFAARITSEAVVVRRLE